MYYSLINFITRLFKKNKILAILIIVVLVGVMVFSYYQTHNKNSSTHNTNPSHSKTTSGSNNGNGDTGSVSADLNKTIKTARTDKIVIDDMHNGKGACTLRVSDTNGKIYDLTDANMKLSEVKDLMDKGYYLPDPNCTPGGIDTAVNQDNIDKTICVSGYTATVRPPASATNKMKSASYENYSIKADKTVEYDHLISLQLGGASTTSNLFVEPNRSGAPSTTNPKDGVENALKKAVCAKKITLVQAQNAISTNWVTAEKVLGLPDTLNSKDDTKDDDDNG